MRVIAASEVEQTLDFPSLVERLLHAFRVGCTVPLRQHFDVPVPGGTQGSMLVMPAWVEGKFLGVKIVSVFPDNAARKMDSVLGSYILMSAKTGMPLAAIDGRMLTLRRTAAASALAARFLARPDSARLLMVGTGALAPQLVLAHASVRPIREVLVWGRAADKAQRLAAVLDGRRMTVRATTDLASAVTGADIISCATMTREPLVRGEWLKPGQHLDLVGGYTPEMRETDDAAIERARVYVDTRAGALAEAGDIIQPIRNGVLMEVQIAGELAELAQGRAPGRSYYNQITLFKSCGTALEDLAAAVMVFERTLAPAAGDSLP
jgi:ornithine cyclodeaminase